MSTTEKVKSELLELGVAYVPDEDRWYHPAHRQQWLSETPAEYLGWLKGFERGADFAQLQAVALMAEQGARIDWIIWVPGAIIDTDWTPDAFQEFCEYLPIAADDPLYAALPCVARFADGDADPKAADVANALALADVQGFLVRASTLHREYFRDDGWTTGGLTRHSWFYFARTFDIVVGVAGWAENLHAHELQAYQAKHGDQSREPAP